MSYTKRHPSPDGAFYVLTADHEVRMSHWISSASLHAASPDALLTDVGGSGWSADRIEWGDGGRAVTLSLRRYPGDAPSVEVRLFPADRVAEVDGRSLAFAELSSALEDFYRRNRKRSSLP
jgi:hypothetical protein